MRFLLQSADAELLIQFEHHPSLSELAQSLGKDQTVVSRQLKRIAEQGDFLTKVSGRWTLTEAGKRLNNVNRDFILAQNHALQETVHLRIGTTREFASRILASRFPELKKCLSVDLISLMSYENGTEEALLTNEIDIAFDCGRPYSPEIAYHRIFDEPISPVVSARQFRRYREVTQFSELEDYPHILCSRLSPDRVKQGRFQVRNKVIQTNDIATARSLCLSGNGWALLPLYTIREELKQKRLAVVGDIEFKNEKFGVWSLRDRPHLKKFHQSLTRWGRSISDQI